ncbi:MAG: GDYXXLXY domain-containing protein [Bacteroidota bacterium]
MNLRSIAFFIVMLLYLWMPFSMIREHQNTLSQGQIHLFRTRPVDPYDAFRGRYVALDIAENQVNLQGQDPDRFRAGQTVYVTIGTDPQGYAFYESISTQHPDHSNYLQTTVLSLQEDQVYLNTPENLRRYYLNEKMAPLAEKVYRTLNRQARTVEKTAAAHLEVSVLDGAVIIRELFLEGQTVGAYLEQINPEDF